MVQRARASVISSLVLSLGVFCVTPAAAADAVMLPSLAFTVTPSTAGGPWKMTIENTGDVPVRLAADPRLLVLEVTPPASSVPVPKGGKKAPAPKTVKCTLPNDTRPSADDGRELVVPPKRSWSATFDPLFYCFGTKERAALLPSSTVTARFGWTPPKVVARPGKVSFPSPPFVATPMTGGVGPIAPTKEIVSSTFTLSDTFSTLPQTPPAPEESRSPLSLSGPAAVDVSRGKQISTTVTVSNTGERPQTLLARPETLAFQVNGPAGSINCGAPRAIENPIRELFSTIAARGKSSLTVLLDATCPPETFDEPGIYRVIPRLDTSAASGRSIGLKTWDGNVQGKVPVLVRVRGQRRPSAPTKPTLD
jgi:hypothetical protein